MSLSDFSSNEDVQSEDEKSGSDINQVRIKKGNSLEEYDDEDDNDDNGLRSNNGTNKDDNNNQPR